MIIPTPYLMSVRFNWGAITQISYIGSGRALFLANSGTRLWANQLSEMAGRYVRLSGIKGTGACHLFRHAAATSMLDNGAELRDVQEMLGHASILTEFCV